MPEQSALIVIDIQNDFCEGGALAVPNGSDIIDGVNDLMGSFGTVVLSQDWHPQDHLSFASQHKGKSAYEMVEMRYGPQVLWPDHCVQGRGGSEFHANLKTNAAQMIVRKGFRRDIDSYSAFFENDHETPTGLHGFLQERSVSHVTLVGLAFDFCVHYSALDAAKLGYSVEVRQNLCRSIDLDGSHAAAVVAMTRAGISIN